MQVTKGAPLACGDGGLVPNTLLAAVLRAPRVWGWRSPVAALGLASRVRPSRAGMAVPTHRFLFSRHDVPLACGDGGADRRRAASQVATRPRAWGWRHDLLGAVMRGEARPARTRGRRVRPSPPRRPTGARLSDAGMADRKKSGEVERNGPALGCGDGGRSCRARRPVRPRGPRAEGAAVTRPSCCRTAKRTVHGRGDGGSQQPIRLALRGLGSGSRMRGRRVVLLLPWAWGRRSSHRATSGSISAVAHEREDGRVTLEATRRGAPSDPRA